MSTEQASEVQEIRKKHRKPFSSKRQELHPERRKLRRARNANDSQTIAQQEILTLTLQEQLRQIRLNENQEIRSILTPEQREKFEQVLEKRAITRGSSRDERDF